MFGFIFVSVVCLTLQPMILITFTDFALEHPLKFRAVKYYFAEMETACNSAHFIIDFKKLFLFRV